MRRNPNILIAGAGVGGLAVAVRLARRGLQVQVFDQSPAPLPIGSGLVMQPVGLTALADLGLDAPLIALGAPIDRLLGLSQPSGRIVLDAHYAKGGSQRFGLAVQRAALYELLYQAAVDAGVAIRHGATVASASPEGRLVLDSGETLAGNLVVDALGVRSPLSPEAGRDLDYGALWGLLDWPADAAFSKTRLEQRYERASKMAGVLPLGATPSDPAYKVAYFWSMHRDSLASWRATPLDVWKAEAEALWPQTRPLLDQITDHSDLTEATYRHRTLPSPSKGRIVHIGDSFHAASPQLGQGANMALLDAAALDYSLLKNVEMPDALQSFHKMRRLHVGVYQTASRLFTPVYQSDSKALPVLRDHLLAPLSRSWPGARIVSELVAGTLANPLARIGL